MSPFQQFVARIALKMPTSAGGHWCVFFNVLPCFNQNQASSCSQFGISIPVYLLLGPVLLEITSALLSRRPKPSPIRLLPGKLPIVYHNRYNISACGIEKCHPFDSQKVSSIWGVPLYQLRNLLHPVWPCVQASSSLSGASTKESVLAHLTSHQC